MKSAYATRTCRCCGKKFPPRFPNQRVCRSCWPKWRREYKKRYERKVRKEMKQDFAERDEA